jgi:hypothetical protein
VLEIVVTRTLVDLLRQAMLHDERIARKLPSHELKHVLKKR